MPQIWDVAHVVVTGNFAGTERYVCTVANHTAQRGLRIAVVGGDPRRMRAELNDEVSWFPGASLMQAGAALITLGRVSVCHAHLTLADALSVALRHWHRGQIVSTRHIAAPRGSSRAGALLSPWIARHVDCEIAISHYVAERLQQPPDVVIHNAVPGAPAQWSAENRSVLVLQRLEAEKDTATALRAWKSSGLSAVGWNLTLVGDGSQRAHLQELIQHEQIEGVCWAGHVADVRPYLAQAGLLLAPAPGEPLGLSVLEAMAAGVPVVASLAGGHLETLPALLRERGFAAGDAKGAGRQLLSLGTDAKARAMCAAAAREHQQKEFSLDGMVDRLLDVYDAR